VAKARQRQFARFHRTAGHVRAFKHADLPATFCQMRGADRCMPVADAIAQPSVCPRGSHCNL
jgi:hypothetical protein